MDMAPRGTFWALEARSLIDGIAREALKHVSNVAGFQTRRVFDTESSIERRLWSWSSLPTAEWRVTEGRCLPSAGADEKARTRARVEEEL